MGTTFTTSKGDTFTSTLTDQQAFAACQSMTSNFAQSLTSRSLDRLSRVQVVWLHKLAMDAMNPVQRETINIDVNAIAAMFAKASTSLKRPKIHVQVEEGFGLTLSRKDDGTIYVRDAINVDSGASAQYGFTVMKYHGKIDGNGFLPTRNCPQWVKDLLQQFATDPIGFAVRFGRLTGKCCFCGRNLTDEDSTARGYGPVCAQRYGLDLHPTEVEA